MDDQDKTKEELLIELADLRRSEAKFRAMVENSHDGIAFATAEGVFLYRSSSYNNLDGYTAEEQLGQNGFADIHPEDIERVRQLWEYGLQHPDTSHRVEYRLKHKDGAWRWVESLGQNFLGNPDIQAVVLASRDITERKQAEEDLRKSEALFRAVVEHSHDGIVLTDATGRVLYRSPSHEKINGFTDQERIGQSGFDTVHPDDLDAVRNLWAEMLRHPETVVTLEYRVRHKDGSWKWIETFGRNLLANPEIEAIVLNSHDITERREAEDRRRESEARFRALNEDSLVGVYIIQEGVATYVNPTLEKIFGYEPGELLGCSPLVIAHPDDHALISENIRRRLAGEIKSAEYEFRGRRKNGELIHVETMGARIDLDGRPAIVGHLLDITERKQAQGDLQASEEKYHSLFENVPVAIYRTTPAGKVIDFNEYGLKMLGFADRESALEVNTNDLWRDPAERAKLAEELKKTGFVRDFDTQFRRPDGSIIWVRNNVRVTYDQNGQVAFFDGTLQDITESKQAEEKLHARNRYIETIMENAPIGFAVNTVDDGIARFVSNKFEEIYGIPRGALNSFENFFDLVLRDPVFREEMRARVIEDIATGDPARMVWEDIPVQLASGEIRYITAKDIPLLEQNLLVSTVQDVTGRVRAEESLRKSEALYRAVVENSHDGIVMMDSERRVKHVSLSYQHLSGYSLEEVVDSSGIDYVHPEDRALTAVAFRELLQTPGASRTVQYRLLHKNGGWIWIETIATNLLHDPQAQAVVLSSRDITERMRAEDALRVSEQTARQTAERLRMVNQMMANITSGLELEHLMQKLHEQCRLIGAIDTFYVLLYDAESETLSSIYDYKDGEHRILPPRNIREYPGLTGYVIESRETLHIPDALNRHDGLPSGIPQSGKPSRSIVIVPLIFKGGIIGVLSMQNTEPNAYTLEQIQTLELFAPQVAIAIENSRREAAAHRSALEERQRIARDLHDAVSQTLFSASFASEMLLQQRKTITPRELWKSVKHLSTLVTSALGEMRILLLELRPESLAGSDLPTLLQHLKNAAGSRINAKINLEVKGDHEIPVEPKIAFYRIAQEALNNSIKHANCTEINISLSVQPDAAEIRVEDNGAGFDLNKSAGTKMGLNIMRERANQIGADLKVISKPKKGAQVICKWAAGGQA